MDFGEDGEEGGIKGREARGENEKALSPFTRFRITKKSRGVVGKEGEVE